MKILYLDHPQFDLGAFNLYTGLCEVLGSDNIIVFPYKRLYHGHADYGNDGYMNFLRNIIRTQPLPQGIPPFQPNEDILNGWPNIKENPYFVTQLEQRQYTEEEIVGLIKMGTFSFIVLASSNRVNTLALARIRDIMSGKLPPIIYVDNGERDELNEHWIHVFHPSVIFKLILTPSVYLHIKEKYGWELHSLPQSSCMAGKNIRNLLTNHSGMIPDYITLNSADKCIDFFYALGMTYDKRAELTSILTKFDKSSSFLGVSKSTIGYHGFLNIIAHSKIAVSMRGSGRDTSRYWDIPMLKTLMMCDGTMGCIHPHPFEHGKTAVFYNEDNLKEVPDILRYYLEHDTERDRITAAGQEHLLKYHTNKARAEYFLEITDKELRQQS